MASLALDLPIACCENDVFCLNLRGSKREPWAVRHRAFVPKHIIALRPAAYASRLNQVDLRARRRSPDLVETTDRRSPCPGKLARAVVSGSMRKLVIAALEKIDAVPLFPVIVTADDPVAAKPSPEIFLKAARQLRIAPEKCHVFEDADAGITATRAAGMTWTDLLPWYTFSHLLTLPLATSDRARCRQQLAPR